MTDYASALQEISLNVLSKEATEATPQAVFTAAGDSSGTLSNVDDSMKYSTDGGASWTDITAAMYQPVRNSSFSFSHRRAAPSD